MPLFCGRTGEVSVIRKITGSDKVRQRLAELGFTVGEKVEVLARCGNNLIVGIKDCRIAIDAGLAGRIIVG